jgi:delta-aminolevulinic acid dehydratase/porphobilinogen synthase
MIVTLAFDPYSIYGHDGIIANGDVENDSTNDALVKCRLMHKQVLIVAPSDMMDDVYYALPRFRCCRISQWAS